MRANHLGMHRICGVVYRPLSLLAAAVAGVLYGPSLRSRIDRRKGLACDDCAAALSSLKRRVSSCAVANSVPCKASAAAARSPWPNAAGGRALGLTLFHEQVIRVSMTAPGFTAGEGDDLLRAMAAWKKHGGLEKYQTKLIKGMRARGYDEPLPNRSIGRSRASPRAMRRHSRCWSMPATGSGTWDFSTRAGSRCPCRQPTFERARCAIKCLPTHS